ncbi:MexH family multidrug efflux RND transporter periplasmic adaptor subunit [Tenacibaculum sp. KUL152]|jgi:membrane fusion protein (multidrug efflux system)|uniref:efflux RND transporter periplasmic adaptor subunit n=1 Tax=unclassified Alteromonas TaxID=2614992 RepID=UPI0012E43140|nr:MULTISPECIES: efflux RND transporter periplasmic adaptor subunit [unclassified Alteromonas]BCO17758.1 MexH family multidrug efflux RND transporter periplasmic adaptor subunit [Alteromonas sp. KC3]BCO21719.1 MexH family multidrug efflux RND transporter periplasmic adaptor subunit [Alteromonas sp. KC14]GFD88495.1 MexH family multidrug efflux RND transporter periplasmic adaptor subunit [Tenacibaculum sp. KUL152]
MSSRFSLSPLLIGVVLLAGVVVYLNLPENEAAQRSGPRATPVKTAIVSAKTFPITIESLGTTIANESVNITSQVTDTVQAINFDDGDKVEQGELLVQLNNSQERARVEELKANIEEAKRQFSRIADLRQSNATSEQLLDEQQARVKALEAQLDIARAQLSDLQIRAPFSGLLGNRVISIGSLVQPGSTITTLDDISVVKVDFSIAENHLASVAKGQRITASSVAYPGVDFEGVISNIDTRLDPVSRAIRARAIIQNKDGRLRPGMLLTVTVEKRVLDTLVVPEKALVPVEDKQFVYVVKDDVAHQVEVTIGERRPGLVQIVNGLVSGDEVITEGTLRVRDQSPVNVLNR